MSKRNAGRLTLALCALLCASAHAPARQDARPTPSPSSREARKTFTLQIEVSADDTSDKIERAAVHVESKEAGERFTKELYTNKQGVLTVSQVPQGRLLIQVVARQYETFGDDFNLTQDNQTIRITLKKRTGQ